MNITKKLILIAMIGLLLFSCTRKTPQEELQEIYKLAQQRELLESIIRTQDFIRKYPESEEIWEARMILASLYKQQKEFAKAMKEFNDVYEALGTSARWGFIAITEMVALYEMQQEYEKAAALIDKVGADLKPEQEEYKFVLIAKFRVLFAAQEYDECMLILNKVFELYSEEDRIVGDATGLVLLLVKQSKKYDEGITALKAFEAKIDPAGEVAINVKFIKASIFKEAQKYDKASELYTEMMKNDIEKVCNTAAIEMGQMLKIQKKDQEAIDHYKAYQKMYPDRIFSNWLNVEISKIYKDMGNEALAKEFFDNAISGYEKLMEASVDPDEACKISLELGDAYYDVGDYETATKQFNKTIENFGDSSTIILAYGKIASSYEKSGDIENAEIWYKKILEKFPRSQIAQDSYRKLMEINQAKQAAMRQPELNDDVEGAEESVEKEAEKTEAVEK